MVGGGNMIEGSSFRRAIVYSILFSLCSLLILAWILSKPTTTDHPSAKEYYKGIPVRTPSTPTPSRYLSYQPPGNGWNNQRVALEGAMLMAMMLNRTLIVHPLASHSFTMDMKKRVMEPEERNGYLAYNKMQQHNLVPLSLFLDLDLISRVVPVMEYNHTHETFLQSYSHLRWHRVCHSAGFGYWADRQPESEIEMMLWGKQVFGFLSFYRNKCPIEIEEAKNSDKPIVKFVSNFKEDDSDMLYIEEGTIFGVQFRFMSFEDTLRAQETIIKHVRYNKGVYNRVGVVKDRLGPYNAMHVRRVDHAGRQLTRHNWLVRMFDQDFVKDTPIYVATDESRLSWFQPLIKEGFKLFFAKDFPDVLNFTHLHESVRQDILGIHEQVICELAESFIPTGHSTFSHYIQRVRGEVDSRDGLYMETVHSFWIGHTIG